MKPRTFTQSMSWLHTWCGLLLGWLLFAIFFTGTLAVFDKEINWWMQPELADSGLDAGAAAEVAQLWLERHHADAGNWNVGLPSARAPQLSVSVGEQRRGGGQVLDSASGELVQARETVGGNFFFRFHFSLLSRDIGVWVVGLAAMAMLVALISGIVIHKKIFKDFFTFRPAKGQRSWLDGHNASAVLLLPFHLMITYTGLAIFFVLYMPAALDALYDGDRMAMQREASGGGAMLQDGGRAGDQAHAPQSGGEARGQGRGEHAGRPKEEGAVQARGERRAPRRETPLAPPAELRSLTEFVAKGEAHYGDGMLAGLAVSNPGRADARVTVRPQLGNRIELSKGEGMVFHGVTGELLQAPQPSRASLLTQRVMAGLHFAQFGGYPMRWLYFLSGLVSCAMIASGLVLYTVKQRKQARSVGQLRFLRAVEGINVAVVAGLAVACATLLWANRLLPTELTERAGWELRLFFAVWLLALPHALLRQPLQAWREQLCAAALLALGLPLLDVLAGVADADGLRLSLDAGAVLLGLLLGWTAWRIPTQRQVVGKREAVAGRVAEAGQ